MAAWGACTVGGGWGGGGGGGVSRRFAISFNSITVNNSVVPCAAMTAPATSSGDRPSPRGWVELE